MRIWSWQHVSVNISSGAELSPVYCCLVLLIFDSIKLCWVIVGWYLVTFNCSSPSVDSVAWLSFVRSDIFLQTHSGSFILVLHINFWSDWDLIFTHTKCLEKKIGYIPPLQSFDNIICWLKWSKRLCDQSAEQCWQYLHAVPPPFCKHFWLRKSCNSNILNNFRKKYFESL